MGHQETILNLLGSSPKTHGEIQTAIGKDIDIRNALMRLLNDKKIVISGHKKNKKNYSHTNIIFKKVNPNIFNQIYIKNMIEEAHQQDNLNKLLRLFEWKVISINEAYQRDIKLLKEKIGKKAIKDALQEIKREDYFDKTAIGKKNSQPMIDRLEEYGKIYPNAQIWYLKEFSAKNLELKKILIVLGGGPPYYLSRLDVDKDGNMTTNDFIRTYYGLSYLPINPNYIEELFSKLIKHILSIKTDKREENQWELAELLSDDVSERMFAYYLNNFIEEIENQDPKNKEYMDNYLLY